MKNIPPRDMELLKNSLRDQGIHYLPSEQEIESYAPANEKANFRIFEDTNHKLDLLLAKTDLGKTIHITTGLRALTDPYHRLVCRNNYHRYKTPLIFLYYFPPEKTLNPISLIEWFIEYWGQAKSLDALEAFYLISTEQVKLYFSTEEPAFQYSVFPGGYILYQEKHSIHHRIKKRWFLKSEKLNKNLYDVASSVLDNAKTVPNDFFKDFLKIVTGEKAFNVLERLRLIDRIEEKFYSRYPIKVLQYLKSVRFIRKDSENYLLLTEQGKEFLERRQIWLEMGKELMPRIDIDEKASNNLCLEKIIKKYPEQKGYIDSITDDSYVIYLETAMGVMRCYRFPKKFARGILHENDNVRCYVVETAGNLEPRLEKINKPTEVVTDAAIIRKEYEESLTKILPKLEKRLRRHYKDESK